MGHNRAGDRRKRRLKRRRREATRLAVRPLALDGFRAEYAWNPRREELFEKLVEEIENIRRQVRRFRVYAFGSYLRGTPTPGDVDLLVSYEPKGFPPFIKRVHPRDIQVVARSHMTAAGFVLYSRDEMVAEFNNSPGNVEQGIKLDPREVRELSV